jgi:hypothetical protein
MIRLCIALSCSDGKPPAEENKETRHNP